MEAGGALGSTDWAPLPADPSLLTPPTLTPPVLRKRMGDSGDSDRGSPPENEVEEGQSPGQPSSGPHRKRSGSDAAEKTSPTAEHADLGRRKSLPAGAPGLASKSRNGRRDSELARRSSTFDDLAVALKDSSAEGLPASPPALPERPRSRSYGEKASAAESAEGKHRSPARKKGKRSGKSGSSSPAGASLAADWVPKEKGDKHRRAGSAGSEPPAASSGESERRKRRSKDGRRRHHARHRSEESGKGSEDRKSRRRRRRVHGRHSGRPSSSTSSSSSRKSKSPRVSGEGRRSKTTLTAIDTGVATTSRRRNQRRPSIMPETTSSLLSGEDHEPKKNLSDPSMKEAFQDTLDSFDKRGTFDDSFNNRDSFDGGWSSESSISSISAASGDEDELEGEYETADGGEPTATSPSGPSAASRLLLPERATLSRGPSSEAITRLDDITKSNTHVASWGDIASSSPHVSPKNSMEFKGSKDFAIGLNRLMGRRNSKQEISLGISVSTDESGCTVLQSARTEYIPGILSGRSAFMLASKAGDTDAEKTESFLDFADVVLHSLPYFMTPAQLAKGMMDEFEHIPLLKKPDAPLTDRHRMQGTRVVAFFVRWVEVHYEIMRVSEGALRIVVDSLVTLFAHGATLRQTEHGKALGKLVKTQVGKSIRAVQYHLTAEIRQSAADSDSINDCGGHHRPGRGTQAYESVLKRLDQSSPGIANVLASPMLLQAIVTHPEARLAHGKKGDLAQFFIMSEVVNFMCERLPHAIQGTKPDARGKMPLGAICVELLNNHLLLKEGTKKFQDKKKAFTFRSQEPAPEPKSSKKGQKKSSKKHSDENGHAQLCNSCSRTVFGHDWHEGFDSTLPIMHTTFARALRPVLDRDFPLSAQSFAESDLNEVTSRAPVRSDSKAVLRTVSLLGEHLGLDPDEFLCVSCGRIAGPPDLPNSAMQELSSMEFVTTTLRPSEFAIQLTILDARLFSEIPLDDFRMQNWQKNTEIQDGGVGERDHTCVPGAVMRHFINHINRMTYWVATELITARNQKQRVRTLKYFIFVAQECLKRYNFSSLFAIVNGIHLVKVADAPQLTTMWDGIGSRATKVFKSLDNMTSPASNYGRYRRELKELLRAGAADKPLPRTSSSSSLTPRPPPGLPPSSPRGAVSAPVATSGLVPSRTAAVQPLFGSPANWDDPAETLCIIPNIALFMKDLSNVEELLDDFIKDDAATVPPGEKLEKSLNLDKMRLVADNLSVVQRCQVECRETIPFTYTEVSAVQDFLEEKVHSGEMITTEQLQQQASIIGKTLKGSGTSSRALGRRVSMFFTGKNDE